MTAGFASVLFLVFGFRKKSAPDVGAKFSLLSTERARTAEPMEAVSMSAPSEVTRRYVVMFCDESPSTSTVLCRVYCTPGVATAEYLK